MSVVASAEKAIRIEEEDDDTNVEQFRIRKLIKRLTEARGNGTSMISLIVRPKDEISRLSKMLADEYGTASNIKSRVNRLSVLDAITSTQQRLKLYQKVPPNGLVLYCGTVLTDQNKAKKVTIDFEPFRPICTSLYLCDNKFHTEALNELLESDEKYGFIVMDGLGSLFATLTGSHREVLHRITVDLPKKHGRGGQSALRFARLRIEKRHNYIRRVAEIATQLFITNDRPNINGLILAGLADFKTELSQSDLFDPRLQNILIKIVDVSYGGDNGFNQAIELSSEELKNVKFVREKRVVSEFLEEIALDSGKYAFGLDDTFKALEMGAMSLCICWDSLAAVRCTLKNPTTGAESVVNFLDENHKDPHLLKDPNTGADLEIIEEIPVVEWLAEHFKEFGTKLEIVTNRSSEGSQFCRGFGGIGGLLRYQVDFMLLNEGTKEAVDDGDDYLYDEDDFENPF